MGYEPLETRRRFLNAALALPALPHVGKARPLDPLTPGIKIAMQLPDSFTSADLAFTKQLGVRYVAVSTIAGRYEDFAEIKRKVESTGLEVSNIGRAKVHNMPEVVLNLPGRDQKIEEYKQYLRDLGNAGIHYTTYAHMGNGIWSSDTELTRGGAGVRHGQPRQGGRVGRQNVERAAFARARVHQR